MSSNETKCVAVLGLGYVGLPLALGFGRKITTIGFDISPQKINAYKKGFDPTDEMAAEKFAAAKFITYHNDPAELKKADVIIVAVPTPINEAKQPDLTPVEKASVTVGRNLRPVRRWFTSPQFIPGLRKRCVCRFWSVSLG